MRKQIIILLGAGLISLMHPAAVQADPLDFTFSFSNVNGSVPGTVTGEIFGLTDNASGPASMVELLTYPMSLEPPDPPQFMDTDVTQNFFTVTDEEITLAEYAASNDSELLLLNINIDHRNFLSNLVSFLVLSNSNGFDGVTYTLVPSILEPSSVTLLGTGLGLAALWQLRQRRRRRWAAA
jgi:hypothetical protein